MAALTSPYWNAVSPEMRQLLIRIGNQTFSQKFYLAGGTALSLHLGHRRSVDFDFFSESDELVEHSRSDILRGLSSFSFQVIENTTGNLLLLVDGIRTGFFSYGYPLVAEPVQLGNVALASLLDIGLMKCDALISRGSRKDFYDLYYLTRDLNFEQLLAAGEKKYSGFRDFQLMVLESMTLFDNADRDVQPELFEMVSWEKAKEYFIQQAGLLSKHWFDFK